MQFLPGTWGYFAADANDDDVASPHNLYDAAGAAGRLLCLGRGDLTTDAQYRSALLAYNNSIAYTGQVVAVEAGRIEDPRCRRSTCPTWHRRRTRTCRRSGLSQRVRPGHPPRLAVRRAAGGELAELRVSPRASEQRTDTGLRGPAADACDPCPPRSR